MATDFTNNNTTINTSGGLKPTTKNTPLDVRTRVNTKADIDSIPNPFVGMKIIVLQDETNSNKMTEYIVTSLKANSLGVADTKVNEVILAKDFLGVSGSTSGSGMTSEQVQQLNTAYTHSQTSHVQQSDIPTKTSQLINDSDFATKNYVDDEISKIVLESSNIVFRDIMEGEIFEIIADTDAPVVGYGNIIISATSLTVNENDTTTFTVKLDKAPINNQTVNVSVNNAYCALNKTSLTFTTSNYSTAQTVTVSGVHDSANYSDKTSIITVSSSNVSNKTINVTLKNVDSKQEQEDVENDNLILWVNGADMGDDPSIWKDKSGKGNHMTISNPENVKVEDGNVEFSGAIGGGLDSMAFTELNLVNKSLTIILKGKLSSDFKFGGNHSATIYCNVRHDRIAFFRKNISFEPLCETGAIFNSTDISELAITHDINTKECKIYMNKQLVGSGVLDSDCKTSCWFTLGGFDKGSANKVIIQDCKIYDTVINVNEEVII